MELVEIERAEQVWRRLQDSAEVLDPEAKREILAMTEYISRTVHVFIRDDVTMSDWENADPGTRGMIILAHGNLEKQLQRMVDISGIDAEPALSHRQSGDLLMLAEVSAGVQYLLYSFRSWEFVVPPELASDVAVAVLQALASLVPLFRAMEAHFVEYPDRLRYLVGNVRGFLDRIDEALF